MLILLVIENYNVVKELVKFIEFVSEVGFKKRWLILISEQSILDRKHYRILCRKKPKPFSHFFKTKKCKFSL